MRRLRLVVAALPILLALTAATASSADRQWTITDLGSLGRPLGGAIAINDRGQVLGGEATASGEFELGLFLWERGVMTPLGTLGGPSAFAPARAPSTSEARSPGRVRPSSSS